MREEIFKKLNITTLRSKNKEELIEIILELYQEIEQIVQALGYIETDIEMIKKGEAFFVHDNP